MFRHLSDCSSATLWHPRSIEVHYLPLMSQKEGEDPQDFADRVGKAMAEAIGATYVPY